LWSKSFFHKVHKKITRTLKNKSFLHGEKSVALDVSQPSVLVLGFFRLAATAPPVANPALPAM
jgi:hypothetical protein